MAGQVLECTAANERRSASDNVLRPVGLRLLMRAVRKRMQCSWVCSSGGSGGKEGVWEESNGRDEKSGERLDDVKGQRCVSTRLGWNYIWKR